LTLSLTRLSGNFFNQTWVTDSKALWTGITGLGFALNGTIAEFVSACVFVFAKHAYDVGDLVEAKTKKLIVQDIHLTHTNFVEIREGDSADATGMVVQIAHAALASEAITNWTRSNDLKIAAKKETEKAQC
jgi:small-conductance mechanosensitive channel